MTNPPAVEPAPELATAAVARPSGRLLAGLTAFVLAFAGAGYAWRGNLAGWGVGPGEPAAAASQEGAGAAAHTMDMSQFEAMADKLAQRLKAQPEDAEGWSMLGRSYSVLNRYGDAAPAFKKVVELRPDDAQALADYADALGMAQGRTLEGEPTRLIEKAVKLDPRNLKALSLAGTVAFQKGAYADAIKLWERGIQAGEPGSEIVRNLQAGIAEARQLAGGGAKAAAAPAAKADAAPAAPDASAPGTSVRGRVTLSAALQVQAAPDDTVFVFARAAEGSRMPLAILRKQVRDLPFDFALDDTMAMSPAARLSGAPLVVVGARISKSGQAMPQPGDLQGLSAPVAPGAQGLAIEINDQVK